MTIRKTPDHFSFVTDEARKFTPEWYQWLQEVYESLSGAESDIATLEGTVSTISGAYVSGPVSSTDNAAARFDGAGGKTIQNSPLVIADTTGALSRSGGGGIPVQGTNGSDLATAGDYGEIMSDSAGFSAITTAVVANRGQKTLTAGDWAVWGHGYFTNTAGFAPTQLIAGISTVSATLQGSEFQMIGVTYTTAADHIIVAPARFLQVANGATQNVYLVVRAVFGGTAQAAGNLRARRMR